jgi:hypothetical protein
LKCFPRRGEKKEEKLTQQEEDEEEVEEEGRNEGRKEGIVERRRRTGPVRARWVVVAETPRHKNVHGTQRENQGAKNTHTHTHKAR